MGKRQAARRPRSDKAEMLTGVLTATRCDPQVKAPAPGFYTGSRPHGRPASQAARSHPPTPAGPPQHDAQPARGSEPQPAAAGTPAISARATIHQMSWLLPPARSPCATCQSGPHPARRPGGPEPARSTEPVQQHIHPGQRVLHPEPLGLLFKPIARGHVGQGAVHSTSPPYPEESTLKPVSC
jgi:hypothetical protein